MTAKTPAQLKAEATTSFPDNTTGFITPAIMRTFQEDIIDSFSNVAVANVKDYGASGDGVTNDHAAIVAACNYVNSFGGGRVYFPAGHYVFTVAGDVITLGNSVEYYGDGYASFIDSAWNVFESMNRVNPFGLSMFGTLTSYPANNIAKGAKSVTTTTASNAGNFAVGDMIIIYATTFFGNGGVSNGTNPPLFTEVNRVTSVNASTGVIGLEDALSDGYNGIQVANVSDKVPYGVHIHNLRLRANTATNSQTFALNGIYKSVIENCWTEGMECFSLNGFARSVYRNNIAKARISSVSNVSHGVEIKFGSHDCVVENNEFSIESLDGTVPANGIIPSDYGEYCRRVTERGSRWLCPGITILNAVSGMEAQGLVIEDYYISAAACTTNLIEDILNFPAPLDDIQTIIRCFKFEIPGAVPVVLYLDTMQNLHISDIVNLGSTTITTAIRFTMAAAASISNVLIENVHLNGLISENGATVYSNVVFRNCSFANANATPGNRITQNMYNQIDFVNCRLYGSTINLPPMIWTANADTLGNVANTIYKSITIPANLVTWADHVEIVGDMYHGVAGADPLNLAIAVAGTVLYTITTGANASAIKLNLRLDFGFGNFASPGFVYLTGIYTIDGVTTNIPLNTSIAYNPAISHTVELQAWNSTSVVNTLQPFGLNILYVPRFVGEQIQK